MKIINQSKIYKKSKCGFTLLEMLLSVSILTIIGLISVPIYQSFQNRNDLDIAATTIAQSLRRAQVLSQASDGDIGWGVKIFSGAVVVFRGADYVGRDVAYDEVFDISSGIAVSGLDEVVFVKFSGLPSGAGDITLTSVNNESRNIVINSKGMVEY